MSVVIVAYETDDVAAVMLAVDDAASTLGREVFRQATAEYVELRDAFVVAARSFDAPRAAR